VVSLENRVNTKASWEGLTGPPPVKVEEPATAAAEAVERAAEDSAALDDVMALGLPTGRTRVDLTNQGKG